MYCREVTERAAALAAIWAVPKVAMRLWVITRPSWNMLFSSPLGMPMLQMLRMVGKWGL